MGGAANDALTTNAREGVQAGEGEGGGRGLLVVILVLSSPLKSTDALPKRPQAKKRRMGSKTTSTLTNTTKGYR